ncbi:MAG: KpsF/GutQ family sugar-phosphate isomerase [Holosporaceae bacterium]|jgi:arabinose-5-phosphate isomerase|nr:KpsF/GutQ family sugar-phosphate isomerase [Holosporaceae bacterium]
MDKHFSQTNYLDYAKSIIREEIVGLESLYGSLNGNIIDATELIYRKRGHVIVSGMGKPGHIGRKISATLASTGTPSFFLHPGEASHGDLGEISADDVLLVLSLSGNTQELIPMLSYANRFAIDVISVTGNPESILARASRVCMRIPNLPEACPYNLVPTTSTTMMLVLGDALALCLLKRKKFNCDDFKKLHPGGTLGKRLLTVGDLMHADVPIVRENDLMKYVLVEMTQKSFGCACVVGTEGKIVGIITDGDLRRGLCPDFLEKEAHEVMSTNPKIVSKMMFAQEATRMMNDLKITSLFITENDVLCGIIHIHDCLRAGLA